MATHVGGGHKTDFDASALSALVITHTGYDGALIAIITSYSLFGVSTPMATNVVRAGVTFTEVVALRKVESLSGALFPNRRISVFYALMPGYYTGGTHDCDITFDGVFKFATAEIHEIQNAYQGTPMNLEFVNDANRWGSLGMELTLTETETNSVICGSNFLLRTTDGAHGSEGYDVVNLSPVVGSQIGLWNGKWWDYSPIQAIPAYNITTSSSKWRENITENDIPCDYMFVMIEVQDVTWDPEQSPGGTIDVDCGYAGQATSDITNLDHLEGQEVAILANGEVLDRQIVINGLIELNGNYSVVHVGLPFEADLETLKIEVPWREGTVQSRRVKVNNVTFRVQNSRGGYIGPNKDDLYEAFTHDAFVRSSGKNLGLLDMFTCDIRQPLGAQFSREGNVFYRQVDPLPITIGAIIPEVSVGGQSR